MTVDAVLSLRSTARPAGDVGSPGTSINKVHVYINSY